MLDILVNSANNSPNTEILANLMKIYLSSNNILFWEKKNEVSMGKKSLEKVVIKAMAMQ